MSAINDDDITTDAADSGEGTADGGANPSGNDGGADGGAGEGPADGGANPGGHDGGADGGAGEGPADGGASAGGQRRRRRRFGLMSDDGRGSGDRPALSRCIAVAPDRFAAEYWGTRPLLSSRSADLGEDFSDLFSTRRRRRAHLGPRAAHAVHPDGQGRHRARARPFHRIRWVRRRDRRPGQLREGAAGVRRRLDDRAAGPASHVAAARRFHAAARGRPRASVPGERLHHAGLVARFRPALRRARRVRDPGRRREALDDPRAGASGSAARPAVDRPPRMPWPRAPPSRPRSMRRSAPATCCTCRAAGSIPRPRSAAYRCTSRSASPPTPGPTSCSG